MKLKTLILAAGVVMLASCGPSTYKATDQPVGMVVPEGTRTTFITAYPDATNIVWTNYDNQVVIPIDWELTGWPVMEANDYVVSFDMGNEKHYAWYDADGTWIGTYVMTDGSLPAAITSVLNDQFYGYTITSVNKELQRNRVAYEIEMQNGMNKTKLLIDASGNVIKQKTKPI
jgi:hypothetical protein